jgi:hypothetical protein
MLVNLLVYTFTFSSPNFSIASYSLIPTTPIGGCEKITVGIREKSILILGLFGWNNLSTRVRPALIATGVSWGASVTSPTA